MRITLISHKLEYIHIRALQGFGGRGARPTGEGEKRGGEMATGQPPAHWSLLPGPQVVPRAPCRCQGRQRTKPRKGMAEVWAQIRPWALALCHVAALLRHSRSHLLLQQRFASSSSPVVQ